MSLPVPYTVGESVSYTVGESLPIPYTVGESLPVPYTVGESVLYIVDESLPVPYTVGESVPYTVGECLSHTLLVSLCLSHTLLVSLCLSHTLLVSLCLSTGEWNQLPDMLHQETAPAVTQHRGNIYVFKNYAQVFHISSSTWTFLELSPPVPGLPLFAHPHPTTTNGILVSCFNSQSLWLVDVDRLQRQLVLNFQTEGGGGVFHRGHVFHFQLHDAEFGVSRGTQVESYSTADMSWSVTGVLPCTVFSSHFVTVPRFPRYTPSSQNQLC